MQYVKKIKDKKACFSLDYYTFFKTVLFHLYAPIVRQYRRKGAKQKAVLQHYFFGQFRFLCFLMFVPSRFDTIDTARLQKVSFVEVFKQISQGNVKGARFEISLKSSALTRSQYSILGFGLKNRIRIQRPPFFVKFQKAVAD